MIFGELSGISAKIASLPATPPSLPTEPRSSVVHDEKRVQQLPWTKGSLQHTWTSASFLSELSVRSPWKLIVFVIYKKNLDQSIQKILCFILKTEELTHTHHEDRVHYVPPHNHEYSELAFRHTPRWTGNCMSLKAHVLQNMTNSNSQCFKKLYETWKNL